MHQQVRHGMLGAVPRDQFSSRERRAPVALVARHQHDRARLVGERVVAPARRPVASLAAACSWIRKDVLPPLLGDRLGGCGQDRRSTASRARSIAVTSLAISSLVESRRTKFGRTVRRLRP
jgi:hypothetical protein